MINPAINLDALSATLERFQEEVCDPADELGGKASLVNDAAREVGESWSRSCLSTHANLYFRGFCPPATHQQFNTEWGLRMGPQAGWVERRVEEVEAQIEKLSGVQLKDYADSVKKLSNHADELHSLLLVELAGLPTLQGQSAVLLSNIESMKFDKAQQTQYIQAVLQTAPSVSRDLTALTSGLRVPTHAFYESLDYWRESVLRNAKTLIRDVHKLLKRINMDREDAKPRPQSATIPSSQVINVQGPNSRVSINSEDRSVNIINMNAKAFADLRAAADEISEPAERRQFLAEVDLLEEAHQKGNFLAGYQRFISQVADYMTIVGPFIPALTKMLGG